MELLLSSDEPAAVEVRHGDGQFLVVCEHASNRIPRSLRSLGLNPTDRQRHIAWDPGALEVAKGVAARLNATLIVQRYSRLVVDCNRSLEFPDAFTEFSEDTRIPGNVGLGEDDKALRVAEIWNPFHDAIDEVIKSRIASGQPTVLVTIHSFTPVYRGVSRPWEVGVIFDRDRRLADAVIRGLHQDPDLSVGINQPYSPADRVFYTIDRHATPHRLPAVMIEIRNDIIAAETGQRHWAGKLASILDSAESEAESAGSLVA